MKSFFLLLFVCILGYFLAPQVLGIKSGSSSKFKNRGEYMAEDCSLYQTVPRQNGAPLATGTVSFLLCLDELENIQENQRLVSFMGNMYEVGIMLSRDGIVANWAGTRWPQGQPLPYSRLADNENVVKMNGSEYLSLTVMSNVAADIAGSNPGVTLVDASGRVILSYDKLCTAYNRMFHKIIVNDNHVSHAALNPRVCSAVVAGKRAQKLEKAVASRSGNKLMAFGGGGVVVLLLAMLWNKLIPAPVVRRHSH